MEQRLIRALVICVAVLTSGPALSEGSMTGILKTLRDVHFSQSDEVTCLFEALQAGDPTTGPSTWILKAPPGCVIRWHSHTAEEQLIIISGTALTEMSEQAPTLLGSGGFAMMGSRMPHQFTCTGKATCLMVVTFNGIYDIRWGKG